MDLNEIKKLIDEDGGKIIIVENGEPVMVVTSYADYKKGRGVRSESRPSVAKDLKPLPPELSNGDLKIEDLPF